MFPLDSSAAHDLEQMNDDEFWNYARECASIVTRFPSREEDYQDQYLDCKLSRGSCLIPLKAIVEVVSPPHRFAQLPFSPGWMRGVLAWRDETIAVIDLDLYLYGTDASPLDGILLVISYTDLKVGLLVPAVGLTTTVQFNQLILSTGPSMFYTPIRTGVVSGVHTEAPVLEVSALLPDLVQQIGMAAHYA